MYQPSQDSYFLSEQLKKFLKEQNKKIKILDMGSGSGIQAIICLNLGFKNIICADIDKESLDYLKRQKLRIIKSNLFEKIPARFDLIIFNPPYLPENKFDKQKDTTGGKKGDETILAFLTQAKSHLKKQGKILLLISSLTPRSRINKLLEKLKYNKKTLATRRIFFEVLEIWLISN